jgi:hypothetical protein
MHTNKSLQQYNKVSDAIASEGDMGGQNIANLYIPYFPCHKVLQVMRPYNLKGIFADLTAYLHVGLRCRAVVGEIFSWEGVKIVSYEVGNKDYLCKNTSTIFCAVLDNSNTYYKAF